jgi:uncharacterized protein YbjT (DUF2867 family)
MNTLVIGGTGLVGSALVGELLSRGVTGVAVVTRSAGKVEELPDGVEGRVADLTDPATFDGVFEGAERLFLLNPVSTTELHEGLSALHEARRVGVEKVVYLSVHNPESGLHIPHFASKIAIERAIRASGLPYVFLRPNNFYQNDFWSRQAILDYGVFPQPIGEPGIARVDVRDVAEAAANALLTSDFDGRAVSLVGPDELTGEDCARAWSEALGRTIAYGGNDLVAWERQSRQFLPAWMVYDLRLMFEVFHQGGFVGTDDDRAATREILGRAPLGYGAFTREVAKMWS